MSGEGQRRVQFREPERRVLKRTREPSPEQEEQAGPPENEDQPGPSEQLADPQPPPRKKEFHPSRLNEDREGGTLSRRDGEQRAHLRERIQELQDQQRNEDHDRILEAIGFAPDPLDPVVAEPVPLIIDEAHPDRAVSQAELNELVAGIQELYQRNLQAEHGDDFQIVRNPPYPDIMIENRDERRRYLHEFHFRFRLQRGLRDGRIPRRIDREEQLFAMGEFEEFREERRRLGRDLREVEREVRENRERRALERLRAREQQRARERQRAREELIEDRIANHEANIRRIQAQADNLILNFDGNLGRRRRELLERARRQPPGGDDVDAEAPNRPRWPRPLQDGGAAPGRNVQDEENMVEFLDQVYGQNLPEVRPPLNAQQNFERRLDILERQNALRNRPRPPSPEPPRPASPDPAAPGPAPAPPVPDPVAIAHAYHVAAARAQGGPGRVALRYERDGEVRNIPIPRPDQLPQRVARYQNLLNAIQRFLPHRVAPNIQEYVEQNLVVVPEDEVAVNPDDVVNPDVPPLEPGVLDEANNPFFNQEVEEQPQREFVWNHEAFFRVQRLFNAFLHYVMQFETVTWQFREIMAAVRDQNPPLMADIRNELDDMRFLLDQIFRYYRLFFVRQENDFAPQLDLFITNRFRHHRDQTMHFQDLAGLLQNGLRARPQNFMDRMNRFLDALMPREGEEMQRWEVLARMDPAEQQRRIELVLAQLEQQQRVELYRIRNERLAAQGDQRPQDPRPEARQVPVMRAGQQVPQVPQPGAFRVVPYPEFQAEMARLINGAAQIRAQLAQNQGPQDPNIAQPVAPAPPVIPPAAPAIQQDDQEAMNRLLNRLAQAAVRIVPPRLPENADQPPEIQPGLYQEYVPVQIPPGDLQNLLQQLQRQYGAPGNLLPAQQLQQQDGAQNQQPVAPAPPQAPAIPPAAPAVDQNDQEAMNRLLNRLAQAAVRIVPPRLPENADQPPENQPGLYQEYVPVQIPPGDLQNLLQQLQGQYGAQNQQPAAPAPPQAPAIPPAAPAIQQNEQDPMNWFVNNLAQAPQIRIIHPRLPENADEPPQIQPRMYQQYVAVQMPPGDQQNLLQQLQGQHGAPGNLLPAQQLQGQDGAQNQQPAAHYLLLNHLPPAGVPYQILHPAPEHLVPPAPAPPAVNAPMQPPDNNRQMLERRFRERLMQFAPVVRPAPAVPPAHQVPQPMMPPVVPPVPVAEPAAPAPAPEAAQPEPPGPPAVEVVHDIPAPPVAEQVPQRPRRPRAPAVPQAAPVAQPPQAPAPEAAQPGRQPIEVITLDDAPEDHRGPVGPVEPNRVPVQRPQLQLDIMNTRVGCLRIRLVSNLTRVRLIENEAVLNRNSERRVDSDRRIEWIQNLRQSIEALRRTVPQPRRLGQYDEEDVALDEERTRGHTEALERYERENAARLRRFRESQRAERRPAEPAREPEPQPAPEVAVPQEPQRAPLHANLIQALQAHAQEQEQMRRAAEQENQSSDDSDGDDEDNAPGNAPAIPRNRREPSPDGILNEVEHEVADEVADDTIDEASDSDKSDDEEGDEDEAPRPLLAEDLNAEIEDMFAELAQDPNQQQEDQGGPAGNENPGQGEAMEGVQEAGPHHREPNHPEADHDYAPPAYRMNQRERSPEFELLDIVPEDAGPIREEDEFMEGIEDVLQELDGALGPGHFAVVVPADGNAEENMEEIWRLQQELEGVPAAAQEEQPSGSNPPAPREDQPAEEAAIEIDVVEQFAEGIQRREQEAEATRAGMANNLERLLAQVPPPPAAPVAPAPQPPPAPPQQQRPPVQPPHNVRAWMRQNIPANEYGRRMMMERQRIRELSAERRRQRAQEERQRIREVEREQEAALPNLWRAEARRQFEQIAPEERAIHGPRIIGEALAARYQEQQMFRDLHGAPPPPRSPSPPPPREPPPRHDDLMREQAQQYMNERIAAQFAHRRQRLEQERRGQVEEVGPDLEQQRHRVPWALFGDLDIEPVDPRALHRRRRRERMYRFIERQLPDRPVHRLVEMVQQMENMEERLIDERLDMLEPREIRDADVVPPAPEEPAIEEPAPRGRPERRQRDDEPHPAEPPVRRARMEEEEEVEQIEEDEEALERAWRRRDRDP
ncbi:hypothetical protein CAEBREN_10777 [Caenorhabditis brenneri]|uniref:Uncharacterized protein n=1 Tax=Caenorhabditis brenneri TaxID=135651 RepID=G0MUU0_CAEBE|nr:hypothetical protein CAEBREN_10777 [Caenorhabditis brenneri]